MTAGSFNSQEAIATLKNILELPPLEPYGAHNKLLGATAAGAALAYVQGLYNTPFNHISSLRYYSLSQYMQLDEISRRNLELVRSIRYGTKYGSLLSVIDQTMTPMGSRFYSNGCCILLDIKEITFRQDIIQSFIDKKQPFKRTAFNLKGNWRYYPFGYPFGF